MATDYKLRIKAQDQSKKGFNSVNKNINSTQNAMKKLAGAFAGAFAVRQIVQFGNESLQLADDIGKLADSVNVSTTFLQQYQYAAEQSGISTEGFTKALRFFSKGVGEATMGTGLAKRAFEEMGISLTDASGATKKTEDLFKEFFVTLESIEEPFKRNGLLAQVFGSRVGIQMANLIKNGTVALDELAQAATGVIPEETIRDAERFNDAMNRLQRQVLTPLRNELITIAVAFLDVGEAMGLIDPDPQVLSLQEMEAEYKRLQKAIVVATLSLRDNNRTDEEGLELREKIKEGLKEDIALRDELNKKITQTKNAQKINTTLLGDTATTQENVNNTIKDSITITKNFADTVDGQLTTAFTNFFDATNKQFLDFKDLATSVARAVINELIQVFLVQKLVGMVKGSINQIQGAVEYNNLTDGGTLFDMNGGGYTGNGVRAGGVDGKGGMLGILHPQETVIDHTKGQGMQSAPTVNFNISTVDAAGFDQLLASRKGLITSIINNAMNNQGKMGIV
jgi:hypothetical protein